MPKRTPKQIVQQQFGGREQLVSALLPLLEDDSADVQRRLRGATNEKLLALHSAASEVRTRFQSKQNLVAEIAKKKFAERGQPEKLFIEKISKLSVKRLLDLHRQVSA